VRAKERAKKARETGRALEDVKLADKPHNYSLLLVRAPPRHTLLVECFNAFLL
jgi:hypothetical protein